jgi:hypothetical protein
MKALGNVLLAGALAVGALAAATAYLVPLDFPDEDLAGLTLSADAGAVPTPSGKEAPVAKRGETLTPGALARLRADGVAYVRVRQFEWRWWPGRWWFVAALVGLLVAAGLLRSASRQEIATAGATRDAELPGRALRSIKETVDGLRRDISGGPAAGPEFQSLSERLGDLGQAQVEAFTHARTFLTERLGPGDLDALRQAIGSPAEEDQLQAIRARLGPAEAVHLETFLRTRAVLAERLGASDLADLPHLLLLPEALQDRLALILERLGEAQKTHMPAFVEARPILIARLGLGGFAELMDRYAAAERQINRAWSAAADGVPAEAAQCLELASVFLDEALDRLSRR